MKRHQWLMYRYRLSLRAKKRHLKINILSTCQLLLRQAQLQLDHHHRFHFQQNTNQGSCCNSSK